MTIPILIYIAVLAVLFLAAAYIDSLAAKIRTLEKESELLKSRLWNLEHQRTKSAFPPQNSPYGFTGTAVCNVVPSVTAPTNIIYTERPSSNNT